MYIVLFYVVHTRILVCYIYSLKFFFTKSQMEKKICNFNVSNRVGISSFPAPLIKIRSLAREEGKTVQDVKILNFPFHLTFRKEKCI